jgi:hypothetical protein
VVLNVSTDLADQFLIAEAVQNVVLNLKLLTDLNADIAHHSNGPLAAHTAQNAGRRDRQKERVIRRFEADDTLIHVHIESVEQFRVPIALRIRRQVQHLTQLRLQSNLQTASRQPTACRRGGGA